MSTQLFTGEEQKTDRWVLPNGLRIVGERLPYLRTVSVGIWHHTGSAMERPEENGLSHFLEHMVFKGTTTRTARQISEEMDAVGGNMNAFTGKDSTCFYAKVIDEDLELAIDMLADLSVRATLDDGELQKERGVILEEIAMDEDSPEDLAADLMSATIFGEQSLGMPILGPAEQVAAYTRQHLADYRARRYDPKQAVLAISGNYDPERIEALCARYFGDWQSEGTPEGMTEQRPLTGKTGIRVKDIEQTHLCLGYPGLAYNAKGQCELNAVCGILGGAMSSRLFQRIREEMGACYTIYSYTNSYETCGTFGIYAGVNPQNAKPVLLEIRREIDRLLRDGITEKELRDTRTQMRAGLLMSLESPGSRMQSMGRSLLLRDRLISTEERVAVMEAMTKDSVMEMAHRILSAEPCVALVGPNADKVPVR